MHKSTAQGEQFFSRTGNESTKGSRKGYSILGGGTSVVDELSPEEKHKSLQARLKWLVAMRASRGLTREEKSELHFIQKDLNKLRPVVRAKKPRSIESFFVDVCREKLSPFQFSLFIAEATERARARDAALAAQQAQASAKGDN